MKSKRRNVIALTMLVAGLLFIAVPMIRKSAAGPPDFSGCTGEHYTAIVNGVSILYERAGEGSPVILLHGNSGCHQDLGLITELLVQNGYEVFAVDSRGQGANARVDDYHYADMAEDVYELIQLWGLEKPALYGWSDGGIIGLLTEIRHPGTLGKLAISGANVTPDGVKGIFAASIAVANAIHPQSLSEMIQNEPNITPEELKTIRIPVLVTAGENDMIKTEHTEMIAEELPDAELVIFDGEDHGSYVIGNAKMGEELLRFLNESEGQVP